MEYQTIKENGKIKFVVLPVEEFNRLLEKIDDDREAIRLSSREPLYDQQEAEEYIFMNPVKRERLEKGWTQTELAQKNEGKTINHCQMGTSRCGLSKNNTEKIRRNFWGKRIKLHVKRLQLNISDNTPSSRFTALGFFSCFD